jgi:hypothetical protein
MAATEFLGSGEIISHEQEAIDLATGGFLIGVQGRAGAYVDETYRCDRRIIRLAFTFAIASIVRVLESRGIIVLGVPTFTPPPQPPAATVASN